MKKIGIITLNGNNNFGNKLQNYALKHVLENYDYNVDTIWFKEEHNIKKNFIKKLLIFKKKYKREMIFENFTKKYLNRKIFNNKIDNFSNFIVGSDQVWNYKFSGVNQNFGRYFLDFSPKEKNIAYAASIGLSEIEGKYQDIFKEGLNNITHISVREESAKQIIKELTNKKIEVLIDPTMLLTAHEWDIIAKKPTQLDKLKNKRYILNYFLGELSEKKQKEIERIANENNCEIINILDKEDSFYISGPSEFLYLEKNAFLICTDSFHSSVFAILFDRPFIVFDREHNGVKSMGSRIDTLLTKFKLENRRFNGEKITKEDLNHDYAKAYEILEEERKKSVKFLKKALNID